MNIPPYLTRLGVPQEVGPVRIGLHFAEDKELSQTELDDARRYLRVGCVGPRALSKVVEWEQNAPHRGPPEADYAPRQHRHWYRLHAP